VVKENQFAKFFNSLSSEYICETLRKIIMYNYIMQYKYRDKAQKCIIYSEICHKNIDSVISIISSHTEISYLTVVLPPASAGGATGGSLNFSAAATCAC